MTLGTAPAVFDTSLFIPEFRNRKKESVLGELVTLAHRRGCVSNGPLLRDTLGLRERVGSTATGKGVAIPNARSLAVLEPRLVLGRSSRGIVWAAEDDTPVHLVLLALSPAEFSQEGHLDFVTQIAGAVRLQRQRTKLLEADTPEAVAGLISEFMA